MAISDPARLPKYDLLEHASLQSINCSYLLCERWSLRSEFTFFFSFCVPYAAEAELNLLRPSWMRSRRALKDSQRCCCVFHSLKRVGSAKIKRDGGRNLKSRDGFLMAGFPRVIPEPVFGEVETSSKDSWNESTPFCCFRRWSP